MSFDLAKFGLILKQLCRSAPRPKHGSLTNWDGYEHLKPEEKVGYLRARAAELARRNR